MPYFVNGISEEEVIIAPLSSFCFDLSLIRPGDFDCVILPALDFWPWCVGACFFFLVVILRRNKNPYKSKKNYLTKPNITFIFSDPTVILCRAFLSSAIDTSQQ